MTDALTLADVHALPAVVDIVTAGRAFGISKNLAYELAAAGTFPCRVYRLGVQWRVPTADLRRSLGLLNEAQEGPT